MINFHRPQFRRSRLVVIGIAAILVLELVSVIVRPTPAQALIPDGGLLGAIWKEVKDQAREIRQDIRAKVTQALKVTSDIAFKNALRVFTGKLAEDTATWIASGGTGQQPLFFSDKRYFQNLADAAAGDFVDTYAQRFFGTSLCQPPPEKLNLLLGITANLTLPNANNLCQQQCTSESAGRQDDIQAIQTALSRAQASFQSSQTVEIFCPVRPGSRAGNPVQPQDYDFDDSLPDVAENRIAPGACVSILQVVVDNARQADSQTLQNCIRQCNTGRRQAQCTFTTIRENIQTLDSLTVSTQASLYLSPENNDIGQLLRVYSESTLRQQQAEQQARDAATIGFLPTTNVTGQQITSPFSAVQQRFGVALDNATKADTTYTGSIAADTIRIFTSTLISRLTERIFKGKCGLNPAACGATGAPNGFALTSLSNVQAAQLQFARLGQIEYIAGDATKTQDIFEVMRSRGLTIDQRLVQAINEKRTVKEALDAGLLDGEKTFGYDVQGNEPQDGYPYRLIVYLRHYRVVPVGWELAAQYLKNFEPQNIGLSELVQLYNKKERVPGPNGTTAEVGSSPFYGLIDPNWVLKAPASFCKRQGSGEETISRQFVCDEDNNAAPGGPGQTGEATPNCGPGGNDVGRWIVARNTDYCSDEQSCIAENDDGTCRQYGYCFAEKNVWRFSGTSCPNYAATCTAVTTPQGVDAAYVVNTTNGQNCSADTAGCRWYCNEASGPDENGNWSCTATGAANKVYLDRDAETCSAGAAGCTQFLTLKNGANLLRNSNFEQITGTVNDTSSDSILAWGFQGNSAAAVSSDNQSIGGNNQVAVKLFSATPPSNPLGTQLTGPLHITQEAMIGRSFAFSVYARTEGGTCELPLSVTVGGNQTTGTATVESSWQRFSVVGPAPTATNNPTVEVSVGAPRSPSGTGACDVIIDAAQLEEGTAPTPYKDYGASNVTYLNGNRVQCEANEIGCERYTPRTGGEAVNGVATPANRCTQAEVGCQAFREMPIERIPTRPAVDPVYFIAATGQRCSARAVGCEEYTNLDEQARGGEARRYYSSIKQCVKPDSSNTEQQTYFSWVGSESQGFELKSYRLLRSNFDAPGSGRGPCTSLSVASADTAPTCNDSASTVAVCSAADVGVNPDCTEFFQADGNITYRLRSRTINVTESCFPARNTNDQADSATRNRLYMISESESIQCAASENNCREYKGNTGNNARTVYQADFEDGTTNGWTGNVGVSTESVNVNGHSMRVQNFAQLTNGPVTQSVAEGKSYVLTFWAKRTTGQPGRIDQVFFTDQNNNVLYLTRPPGVTLTDEWNQYTLGPVFMSRPVNPNETLNWFVDDGDDGSATVFIDNVSLKEFSDSLYVVKGSATSCTAAAVGCQAYTDRANQQHFLTGFTRLCSQDTVGCQEVINTFNSTDPSSTTIKGVITPADSPQFLVLNGQNLCTADNKGCTELGLATLNSSNQVIGWQTQYLKQDPDRYQQILCTANEDMCAEFISKLDGSKLYFRNPEPRTCSYERPARLALCIDGRTPCNLAGGNPASCGTCREQSNTEFRWMITGTDQLCPSQELVDPCSTRVIGSQQYFCHKSQTDAECQVNQCLTRTCEATQSGCTEYRDPSDPVNCRVDCPLVLNGGKPMTVDNNCQPLDVSDGGVPGCQSYYYLRQSVQGSTQDCGTTVDIAGGCRPFLDTSNPSRSFRSN